MPTGDVHVADRLAAIVAERESQIVLGLDPDPNRLWPQPAAAALDAAPDGATPAQRAAAAVLAHCRAVIDALGEAIAGVKPQVACFERLGAPGWAALAEVVEHARASGLYVLADAKRGDIDVTATAYAQGLIGSTPGPEGVGEIPGLGADAMTVAPYMGADTLGSFAAVGREHATGLYVLIRTSNPGAADVEDTRLKSGGALWEHVAGLVAQLGAKSLGPESGLSDVGAVVGATQPEHIARARELLPHATFLLPGVGAQGGRVEDLAPAFAPHPAAGLVTASRSLVRAHEQDGAPADPATAARAEAERLRTTAWSLR
ncbi:orotidine-5'-phosphate decarboxylase [Conexibacter woesei]|uniref:orotidine-5'-phosphate decarboxylase n=1 Tax=Conexibacter woesei TaxID=191495 RepID=UPI0004142813|nr:orotidine-5'-phosphate decarboxylase [Conexibacter woesei]